MFNQYRKSISIWLIIALLALCFSIPAFTQDTTKVDVTESSNGANYQIGIVGSIPMASFDEPVDFGYGLGGAIWFPMSETVSLGAGGAFENYSTSDENTSFWTIPLSANVKWVAFDRIYLIGGALVGFDHFSAKNEEAGLDSSDTSTSWDVNIGAGFDITDKLFAQVEYRGLIDGINTEEDKDQEPRTIRITAGLKF